MIQSTKTIVPQSSEISYPCLLECILTQSVWLMSAKGAGTALLPGPDSAWTLGETSQALLPDSFYHYTGEVTLRNKE